MDSNVLLVKLDSRIDTSNAAEFEKQLAELLKTLANARPQPGSFPRETLIKPNSPCSNEHTRADEFGTLRFDQRVPRYADISLELLEQADEYLPRERLFSPEQKRLLERLINSVPERDTLVHGDFHTRNIFVQGDELILIDMADTSTGHPLFELGSMYMSLVLMSRVPQSFSGSLWGSKRSRRRISSTGFSSSAFPIYPLRNRNLSDKL